MLCLGLTQLQTSTCFSLVHLEAVIVSFFIWALSARAFPSYKPRIFSPRKKWAVWLRRGCFSFADPINTPAVLTINEGRGCRWLHPRHVDDCYKCRADCVISHDKVPLTLSLDPVSESSLRLLLTDEHLRNGASTRQLGENDGLPVGMTVNSPTERVAASYCLLTQSMLCKITLLHIYGPLLKAHMSLRSRLYDKKTCSWRVSKKTNQKSCFDLLSLTSLVTTG